jgi:hypothetical protein
MILDFLWHLRGSVAVDRAWGGEAALDSVQRLLVQQRKLIKRPSPENLTFYAPLWMASGPNWLAMLLYDRGRFWIVQGPKDVRVFYDLRSLHLLVFCLSGAALFFAAGLSDGGIVGGAVSAGLAFGWLYGVNILIALVRVPLAIRRAVHQSYVR